jgi:tetratricopeptide (TPR) repeat protein
MAFFGSFPVLSQKNLNSNSETAIAVSPDLPMPASAPQRAHSDVIEVEKTGDWLMAQHRYQAALETYQRALTPSAKLWSRIGIAYQSLLDPDDAIRCYKESLKLEPDNPRVLNDMATAYDQLDDHRQAERLYRKAIRLTPDSATYLKNLGTNLLAQHKSEQGSEAYGDALTLDPHIFANHSNPLMALPAADNAETNYARARSCAQAGQKDCVLAYLTKALNEGSATPERIAGDGQFNAFRSDPEVQELLTKPHK